MVKRRVVDDSEDEDDDPPPAPAEGAASSEGATPPAEEPEDEEDLFGDKEAAAAPAVKDGDEEDDGLPEDEEEAAMTDDDEDDGLDGGGDDEEEEGEGAGPEGEEEDDIVVSKKRKKSSVSLELDDDDLALVEENTGVAVQVGRACRPHRSFFSRSPFACLWRPGPWTQPPSGAAPARTLAPWTMRARGGGGCAAQLERWQQVPSPLEDTKAAGGGGLGRWKIRAAWRTAPHPPPWAVGRRGPRLRTPERRLRSLGARRGLCNAPRSAPRL